jgi:hypothetical protein
MPTRVLLNDGMTWPWRADGGRFLSLSWVLAEEHAMVPSAVPTQMLGAEVLRWLMGVCFVKYMLEALVSAMLVGLTGRLDGLEKGGLQDNDTAKASL